MKPSVALHGAACVLLVASLPFAGAQEVCVASSGIDVAIHSEVCAVDPYPGVVPSSPIPCGTIAAHVETIPVCVAAP